MSHGVPAWADAQPARIVPRIWLALEYSVYTLSPVGGSPIWLQLRDALIVDGAVVDQFDDTVEFGIVVDLGGSYDAPGCPMLAVAEPALGNLAAIQAVAPSEPPNLWTDGPNTFYALDLVRQRFAADRTAAAGKPVVQALVLGRTASLDSVCTKDVAALKQGDEEYPETVGMRVAREAVQAMAAEGVKTFVVAVKAGVDEDQHLDDLAALGNTGHGPFLPSDRAGIADALHEILRELVSCELPLHGEVVLGRECDGRVTLDGNPLSCNDADGWRLRDESTLELVGAACARLRMQSDATVEAKFPCEVFQTPD
jgi:hypothetical protein